MIAAGNAHCYRNDRRTEAQEMNRRSIVASLVQAATALSAFQASLPIKGHWKFSWK